MKLTESALRNMIKKELKNILAESYFKRVETQATPKEYESAQWSGSRKVWQGDDGKFYKMAVVPATRAEYESARWSGGAGTTVWSDKDLD